jgi:hypothetical protein
VPNVQAYVLRGKTTSLLPTNTSNTLTTLTALLISPADNNEFQTTADLAKEKSTAIHVSHETALILASVWTQSYKI